MSTLTTSPNKVSLICPQCGRGRELRPADARRALKRGSVCRQCHMGNIAPLGYQATREKYGDKFAVQFIRAHLLKHPSGLERKVMRALKRLELSTFAVEREYPIIGYNDKWYLVDFVFMRRAEKIAIEVNGDYVHSFHAKRDAAKRALLCSNGWRVLTLSDSDVNAPDLPARLAQFLGTSFQ